MPRDRKTPKTAFEKHLTSASFLESFSKLHQFLKTDTFTDVKFSVKGTHFVAHKLVLAAHSQVFEAMFSNPMLEASSGQVVIDDVTPRVFGIFLDFLYTGIEPRIDGSETAELFVCADKYGVNSLMVTCEKILCKIMTAKNAIDIYLMAESYNRPLLRRRAFQCMTLHAADIVKTDGWNLIKDDREQLKKIIDFMRKCLKTNLNLGFERPQGRKRDLWLGIDQIKMVVKVDRDTMSHLRPQQFKFNQLRLLSPDGPGPLEIFGNVIFNEDKHDGNRIVVTIRLVELIGWPIVDAFPLLLEISISTQENPDDMIDHVRTSILWTPSNKPTMGSPLHIIYQENEKNLLPKTGLLFFEIKFLDCHSAERVPPKYYLFDDGQQEVEPPTVFEDPVHITGANCSGWTIPLAWLCERTRTLFDTKDCKNFHVSDTPNETLERLIRYMYLNKSSFPPVLPSRDIVDLPMLKAACKLRMDHDLIMYLQHALVWDLDPGNCLNMIEAGTELGLGFLKHGALLFFKLHSDRIINNFPENWNRVKPCVLKEILLDLNWGVLPGKMSFLPNFLTAPRKPVRQIRPARQFRVM